MIFSTWNKTANLLDKKVAVCCTIFGINTCNNNTLIYSILLYKTKDE